MIPFYIPQKKRLLMDDSLQIAAEVHKSQSGLGHMPQPGGCWLQCWREWQVDSRSWGVILYIINIINYLSIIRNIIQKSFTFLKVVDDFNSKNLEIVGSLRESNGHLRFKAARHSVIQKVLPNQQNVCCLLVFSLVSSMFFQLYNH